MEPNQFGGMGAIYSQPGYNPFNAQQGALGTMNMLWQNRQAKAQYGLQQTEMIDQAAQAALSMPDGEPMRNAAILGVQRMVGTGAIDPANAAQEIQRLKALDPNGVKSYLQLVRSHAIPAIQQFRSVTQETPGGGVATGQVSDVTGNVQFGQGYNKGSLYTPPGTQNGAPSVPTGPGAGATGMPRGAPGAAPAAGGGGGAGNAPAATVDPQQGIEAVVGAPERPITPAMTSDEEYQRNDAMYNGDQQRALAGRQGLGQLALMEAHVRNKSFQPGEASEVMDAIINPLAQVVKMMPGFDRLDPKVQAMAEHPTQANVYEELRKLTEAYAISRSGAGGLSTDAGRAMQALALPSGKLTKDALLNVIHVMQGLTEYDVAGANGAIRWLGNNPGQRQFQHGEFDRQWGNNVDPDAFIFKYLSKSERAEFLKGKGGEADSFLAGLAKLHDNGLLKPRPDQPEE